MFNAVKGKLLSYQVIFFTGNDLFEGQEYFINIFSISIIDALPFSDQFIE